MLCYFIFEFYFYFKCSVFNLIFLFRTVLDFTLDFIFKYVKDYRASKVTLHFTFNISQFYI